MSALITGSSTASSETNNGGDLGISTDRYSFDVGRDRLVICTTMFMDRSCFLWLSTPDAEPTLSNMVTAIPTKYDAMPISTTLFGSDDKSSEIAQRLAKRFNIQVFVSYNLPDAYEEASAQVSLKLVDILKEKFRT